jgi:Domain of unknown function (DUF3786)
MSEPSTVFEETYAKYLTQISALDLENVAARIGGVFDGGKIEVKLFSRTYRVSGEGIADPEGRRPTFDQCVILSKYLILAPGYPPTQSEWVNYRGLKDAGPLTTFFSNGIEGAIAGEFAGRAATLRQAGLKLEGFAPEMDAAYDVALQFAALPKVPMVMLLNDADDEFPSQCSVLFERRAEAYLDAECLAMLGSLLFTLLKKQYS